jgi:hypothetical protein
MSYLRGPVPYLVAIFIGLNLLGTGHRDGSNYALLVGISDGMLSTADGGHHWLAEAMDDAGFATSAELSGTKRETGGWSRIIRSLDGGPWTRVCCAGLR